MPLLKQEKDIFPDDLLDVSCQAETDASLDDEGVRWWALYTRSRQEKQLMRGCVVHQIPFYAPLVGRRYRSPAGRMRVSYQPLFPNYVFIRGDESHRYQAVCTSCVSRWLPVPNQDRLLEDLARIHRLIQIGQPVTPEARLESGDLVRVRNGPFAGFEGIVIRRQQRTRLLVAVDFAHQGASVALEDCQLELL